jgi:hypothetical protein
MNAIKCMDTVHTFAARKSGSERCSTYRNAGAMHECGPMDELAMRPNEGRRRRLQCPPASRRNGACPPLTARARGRSRPSIGNGQTLGLGRRACRMRLYQGASFKTNSSASTRVCTRASRAQELEKPLLVTKALAKKACMRGLPQELVRESLQ